MKPTAVAIRTVPQRVEMFGALLARLMRSAERVADPPLVFVSCDATVAPNENGCIALERAAAEGGAEWLVFLEDDADPIDDFFGSVERWLADWSVEDVHVYPLGSVLSVSDVAAIRWPIEQFYCSVALAIRASMAHSLIDYLRVNTHVRTGFDIMTGHWHRTVSPSPHLIAAQPCMVDHIGDDSTLIETRPHRNVVGRFKRFVGRDYSYEGKGALARG